VNCASLRLGRCSIALGIAVIVSTSCGGGLPGAALKTTAAPLVELQSTPVAVYDPITGKTTVVLEFQVRDTAGDSVDPSTATLQRYVDGRLVDVESVLATQDTKVSSNLRLGVVLDASYSMTKWQPPAFEPMKKAAYDMQQSIRTQFSSWGTFESSLSWFQDQYVCAPSSTSMPDSAVLSIPAPQPGDSTRLFASAAQMVDHMKQLHDAIPAPTSADHFAMVVFTDGYDNYSWFDASAAPAISYPATGGSFTCAGTGPVALQDLVGKLQAFPQLKVYVIGLGNQIKLSELTTIAEAGHGRLVSNPDPSQVSTLFGEVAREFTTIRRDGITMPLAPGDYEYVEEVTVGGGTARVRFQFHAGDAATSVNAGSVTTG
jgi:hypothetical protein